MTGTAITDRAPLVVATPAGLRVVTEGWRRGGLSIGMVPTMGALHRGHRSLIDRAAAECDRVVVTIFVNPRQFESADDLGRYPRPLNADLALCAEAGVAAAFVPSVEAMYPPGWSTSVTVTGPAAPVLEGVARPGHFDAVATVVAKLLNAGGPGRVYLGAKDAQQCVVIQRLVADLDLGVEVVICPTVRDPDGLAVSSRNVRLTADDRRRAAAIPRGLADAMRLFDGGERDPKALIAVVRARIAEPGGIRVDYVAVVDPETFADVPMATVKTKILVAARISDVRLIDVVRLGRDALPVPPAGIS